MLFVLVIHSFIHLSVGVRAFVIRLCVRSFFRSSVCCFFRPCGGGFVRPSVCSFVCSYVRSSHGFVQFNPYWVTCLYPAPAQNNFLITNLIHSSVARCALNGSRKEHNQILTRKWKISLRSNPSSLIFGIVPMGLCAPKCFPDFL